MAGAGAVAGGLRWLFADLPSLPRFAVVALGMLMTLGGLLARFEGIIPRSILRHLRVHEPASTGDSPEKPFA